MHPSERIREIANLTAWEKWLREVAEEALLEGNVSLYDIKQLCDRMYEEGRKQGYSSGVNEGYNKAVADTESAAKGYDLSEYKE